MNWLLAKRLLGWLLVFVSGFQLIPIVAAIVFGETTAPYLWQRSLGWDSGSRSGPSCARIPGECGPETVS